jgi:hypothetical protein
MVRPHGVTSTIVAASAALLLSACGATPPIDDNRLPVVPLPDALVRVLTPVIDVTWNGFDTAATQDHVDAIGPTWRLAGNASFDAALDRIRQRLLDSGFDAAQLSVDEYDGSGRGWEHTVGTLALVRDGAADDEVLSRETHRVALAINSLLK